MKKLTRKQIITISIVAAAIFALTVAGIVIGAKRTKKNKEADKKVEAVEKDEAENKEKEEEAEVEETEQGDSVVDESADAEPSGNQTSNQNSTENKVSASKSSTGQSVTQPIPSHVHNWVEIKETVTVPEKGHYEPTYAWIYYCDYCKADLTDTEEQERRDHEKGCVKGGVIKSYRSIGEHWVVDTPSTTEARVTGYKCDCGATREKTQYAGMYTLYDQASWDRLNDCKTFMQSGIRSEFCKVYETYSASYWDSVHVCNSSSSGAWMWIFLSDWKLNDYSSLQDSVREGIIDQAEAKMVEALYEEIPKVFQGCIEKIAPQGGTELYNYVENLIIQANGNPIKVNDLAGAKGTIPENIPGLYVTIEETRGGFSLMFWAE